MDKGKHPVKDAWEIYRRTVVDWDFSLARGEEPNREVVENVFASIEYVFRTYCLPENFSEGRAVEDFPLQIAHHVANQIKYIREGRLPDPIKALIRSGSPGIGPHENNDIALAVAYIKSVRAKNIKDKHPVKTVVKNYGITERCVSRWQKKYSFVEPSYFYPSVTEKERGALLEEGMKQAGVRYKKFGRGSNGRVEFPRSNKKQKPEQTQ